MAQRKLQAWFPAVSYPLIISAPMNPHAGPLLVGEVTKAGGFGVLAGGWDFSNDSSQVKDMDANLAETSRILGLDPASGKPLPVGIGFIALHSTVPSFGENVIPVIKKWKPLAAWLFAPTGGSDSIATLTKELHKAGDSWGLKVFVQVGNVAAARAAVKDGADIIVAQGTDAGGHQFRQGSGVISLVPEVRAMLDTEFADRDIGLVAAGGIADGNAVAAAMALGAEGAVMGTRFIPCPEANCAQYRKDAVLQAKDGGVSTLKSPFHDALGPFFWDPLYDGRAIVTELGRDYLAGASVEDCKKRLKEDWTPEEGIKVINNWAGTGVGLVNDAPPAGELVKRTREVAKQRINELRSYI